MKNPNQNLTIVYPFWSKFVCCLFSSFILSLAVQTPLDGRSSSSWRMWQLFIFLHVVNARGFFCVQWRMEVRIFGAWEGSIGSSMNIGVVITTFHLYFHFLASEQESSRRLFLTICPLQSSSCLWSATSAWLSEEYLPVSFENIWAHLSIEFTHLIFLPLLKKDML